MFNKNYIDVYQIIRVWKMHMTLEDFRREWNPPTFHWDAVPERRTPAPQPVRTCTCASGPARRRGQSASDSMAGRGGEGPFLLAFLLLACIPQPKERFHVPELLKYLCYTCHTWYQAIICDSTVVRFWGSLECHRNSGCLAYRRGESSSHLCHTFAGSWAISVQVNKHYAALSICQTQS